MSVATQLCCQWTLICFLFTIGGSAQSTPPPQCVQNFQIEQDRIDLYIMPGVVNCFSCALDTAGGSVSWQVELNGDLVPVSTSSDTVVSGNFLVIAMPDDYVQPGTSGRREISCSVNNQYLEARLVSPILQRPLFPDITVNEGQLLAISCITRNIPDITTFQILDPNGIQIPTVLGQYRVPNVTRAFAGSYTCCVMSTIDNSTVSAISRVVIQYAPKIIASNSSSQEIIIGEMLYLQCSYSGVPAPVVQWFHNNDILLMDGVNGITININHNITSVLKDEVERTSGGTYTCRATSSVGIDQKSYSIRITGPPDPVTNLVVSSIGEREVSLSWLTGFTGSPPIAIEMDVFPATGSPFRRVLGNVNATIITDLMPFREYKFSIVVVNLDGRSEIVNISATTLSLDLDIVTNVTFVARSSTIILVSWNAPIFDPSTTDDPDFYVVEVSNQDGSHSITRNVPASTDPLMVTLNDLMKGTIYRARIVAYNDRGVGTFTGFFTAQTRVDPPSEPLSVRIQGVGATVLHVTWRVPLDNGGRPILKYRITLREIPSFVVEIENTTFNFIIRRVNLTENTTYIVIVSAANALGFGTAAVSSGRTQSIAQPQKIFDAPLSDSTFSTDSSAMLMWQFPGGSVSHYVIEYVLAQDSDGFASSNVTTKQTVNESQRSTVITNLFPGAIYKFRVAVMNKNGVSQFSECGVFQTLATSSDDPMNNSCMNRYTTTIMIAIAGGLSIVIVLLITVIITVICVCIRRKRKPQRGESDVYYDTVSIGHQPPILETKLNVAYRQPKKQ